MSRPAGIVYCGVSLDGFIARPDGAIDWLETIPVHPDDGDMGWGEFYGAIDAIVMGRKTFAQLLTFDAWHYGDTPMVVWTRGGFEVPASLRERVPESDVRVSSLGPEALFEELGAAGHRRVYIDGGATVQAFMRAGLVSEMTLTTLPILIGEGIPLFGALDGDRVWRHDRTKAFQSGYVQSRYLATPEG